jgi:hypothetical protein
MTKINKINEQVLVLGLQRENLICGYNWIRWSVFAVKHPLQLLRAEVKQLLHIIFFYRDKTNHAPIKCAVLVSEDIRQEAFVRRKETLFDKVLSFFQLDSYSSHTVLGNNYKELLG